MDELPDKFEKLATGCSTSAVERQLNAARGTTLADASGYQADRRLTILPRAVLEKTSVFRAATARHSAPCLDAQ
jgi:hypothetical protein